LSCCADDYIGELTEKEKWLYPYPFFFAENFRN
jgi:hypothetical protein